MTGQTNPRDAPACIALAQRQVGDVGGWTPEQWLAQLTDDGIVRPVDGVQQMFYRPYKTALAYLLRPRVKQRTEGDVSEQEGDLTTTVQNLREMDAEWVAARIPPETTSAEAWDGTITWGGW
ncbi:hypothetical protein [Deinococcus wulumuqiensis]|uniref:hypothetical protein n=1 Tax=Deinococcus wulumuqiensis TaxID=980427 RepID=UPI002431B862|nr:hypothetical protein [Deinococcus wulumuqiensis]